MSNTFTEKFTDHELDCIVSTALLAVSRIHDLKMSIRQAQEVLSEENLTMLPRHRKETERGLEQDRERRIECTQRLGA